MAAYLVGLHTCGQRGSHSFASSTDRECGTHNIVTRDSQDILLQRPCSTRTKQNQRDTLPTLHCWRKPLVSQEASCSPQSAASGSLRRGVQLILMHTETVMLVLAGGRSALCLCTRFAPRRRLPVPVQSMLRCLRWCWLGQYSSPGSHERQSPWPPELPQQPQAAQQCSAW